MSFEGQIALVTGASRGIGRASGLAFARVGAYVVINYRGNEAAAQQSLAAIEAAGGRGELCQFDVAEESQIETAAKKIVDRHKKIDILVNNAGIASDNLLMRAKPADWDEVIGTNLKIGRAHV